VGDRDFAAEFLFDASLLVIHLSRLAEDLLMFSGPACAFVTLGEQYTTGSSLMPQKRNPDALELARGKTGRMIGGLVGLLTTLKGLPSSYNKDLQEDKEPLFDAADTLDVLLPVMAGLVRSLRPDAQKMAAALDPAMLATDLADYLVRRGMPFREAHAIVGGIVRSAEERRIALDQIPLDDLKAESSLFEADVRSVFDFQEAVRRRGLAGGTAPQAVGQQIAQARALLTTRSAWGG
jgi:argininosuccinate lyase